MIILTLWAVVMLVLFLHELGCTPDLVRWGRGL
jgi:hypothetical protein